MKDLYECVQRLKATNQLIMKEMKDEDAGFSLVPAVVDGGIKDESIKEEFPFS